MLQTHHNISKSDHIPLLQKIMFGAGTGMDFLATGLTVTWLWLPVFNIGFGINPAVLGVVLMIFRGWDAISDPIMGNISDNARTRWGRRRPFIVMGAILTALIYPFLWRPPTGFGDTGMVIYMIIMGILFFSSFTCWSMPYYGMQLELTPSYDERTRLTAWIVFFGKIAALLGGWVMAIITGPLFVNPATGESDIVYGIQRFSWVVAGCILCVGLLPAIFVRERYYKAETIKQKKEPLWQSIKESAQCRPMWNLVGISFLLVLGNATLSALGQYVNIYYIFKGNIAEASILYGWRATLISIVGICCIPVWAWLSEKFDKKTIVMTMLLFTVSGHLLNLVCLQPELPYLQLIPAIFESAAIAAVWLFLPSMKADVADYDELVTTRRREGALNAFFSWFIKVALTCAMGIAGLVLQLSGFNASLPEQPESILTRMVVLYISIPFVIWCGALFFIWTYPLTRQRMNKIREQLETRRGKL